MNISHAIARRPGKDMALGITTANLGDPDIFKAMEQFDAYVKTLEGAGVSVTVLDPLEGFPDAQFVEDTAVIVPELAVVTRPGAPARQGEVASMESALQAFRATVRIEPPGTLDGGDVLIAGKQVFIGLSERTDQAGASQLGEYLADFGYTWVGIPVAAGLHFKSSVNMIGHDTLLTTKTFADHPALDHFRCIVVADEEQYAANALLINDHLILPSGYPDTRKKVAGMGKPIIEVDTSEFRKMDGGLTCLSLRF